MPKRWWPERIRHWAGAGQRAALLAILVASTAQAQGWHDRAGDAPLSDEALRTTLIGRVLTFYDGGRSQFSGDGRS